MKRTLGIFIGILLLLLATATALRLRPAAPEGSELYERYKKMPGVRVGFIKDFPLNDSMVVDVTTIEALTDEGWEWLNSEIVNVQYDTLLFQSEGFLRDLPSILEFHYAPHHRPHDWQEAVELPKDERRDIVFLSHYYRWAAIYQPVTREELNIIRDYYIDRCYDDKPMLLPAADENKINRQL